MRRSWLYSWLPIRGAAHGVPRYRKNCESPACHPRTHPQTHSRSRQWTFRTTPNSRNRQLLDDPELEPLPEADLLLPELEPALAFDLAFADAPPPRPATGAPSPGTGRAACLSAAGARARSALSPRS